jgi:hypothetical protein
MGQIDISISSPIVHLAFGLYRHCQVLTDTNHHPFRMGKLM